MCRIDSFISELADLLEKHKARIDSEYYQYDGMEGVSLSISFDDNLRDGEDLGPTLTAEGLKEFLN